jgi:hypothetical protein
VQTHQPANNQPKAGQLSPRVAELVAGEVGTAETRLRAAIEARTRAEQDLEHFKALCAANPDDAELGNKRRAARTFLDDAIDQHEIALAARDRTAKRLEDGSHDLLKLSQLERGIERWNDATWKQWEAQASKRVAAAVAELCTVWAETEQRQREQALARSAAHRHAHASFVPRRTQQSPRPAWIGAYFAIFSLATKSAAWTPGFS